MSRFNKIINTEKHPNADRLKVCDVDIGEQNTIKVVCGAPNAKKNLYKTLIFLPNM